MVSTTVKVLNPCGLHLKPAGYLCNLALNYESLITLKIRNKTVNAKSVLGVLSACIKQNEEVEVVCQGKDEEEALKALKDGFMVGLGEKIVSQ